MQAQYKSQEEKTGAVTIDMSLFGGECVGACGLCSAFVDCLGGVEQMRSCLQRWAKNPLQTPLPQ